MKLRTLILAGLLAAPACSKPNDVPALKEEAVAIPKYFQPRLDVLARRATADSAKLDKIGGNNADAANLVKAARDEVDDLGKLRPNVEQQAATLANKNDALGLRGLAASAQEQYVEKLHAAEDDLLAAEGWISRAERTEVASAAPAATAPTEPATEGSATEGSAAEGSAAAGSAAAGSAAPEAGSAQPNATGQPAPAEKH